MFALSVVIMRVISKDRAKSKFTNEIKRDLVKKTLFAIFRLDLLGLSAYLMSFQYTRTEK